MLARTPSHLTVDRALLDPWRRLLLDGADLIERKGLSKYTLCDQDTGAVCARGALIGEEHLQKRCGWWDVEISVAVSEYPMAKISATLARVAYDADQRLASYLGNCDDVPDWNNAPERTAAEVISAMRACALGDL